MAKTRSVDTPLAELSLRRYEKPYNLTKRELVRKLCLSLGVLQPGDSRDVIVDILYVLLEARKEKKLLSSDDIRDASMKLRSELSLDTLGTASSNVRRQIKRLRKTFLVEKIKNDYRICEFLPISDIFADKVERFLLPSIMERLKEYFTAVDASFSSSPDGKADH